MDISTDERFSVIIEHPLYKKGMAHLQAGEWQEAIQCFETLLDLYGISQPVQHALNEARFKAKFDEAARVRPRQWFFPWRQVAIAGLAIIIVAFLGLQIVRVWNTQVVPFLAQMQEQQRISRLAAEGKAFLNAGRLDEAQARYEELLAQVPDHPEALAGIQQIQRQRELVALCQEAVTRYKAGDLAEARELFTELTFRSSSYCDANRYIAEINRQLTLTDLWNEAEALYQSGDFQGAVQRYEQIKTMDVNYQRDLIAARLYDCYFQLGKALVEKDPPAPGMVPMALDYFGQALALRPRDPQATLEQRLASLYLAGQQAYLEGRWDAAADALGTIYAQRPNYLHGAYIEMLYDAYIRSGDLHRDQQDYHYAWEQYQKASMLPVGEPVVARARMEAVQPMLTPTPTPTATGTPTPVPTPTPIPSPTPTVVLATLHNKIVFWADKEGQTGFWMMNPDGTGRRYLGNDPKLRKQFDELWESERRSPDGRFRVYVTKDKGDPAPMVYIQGEVDQWGKAPTWKVTKDFTKVSYDPVWAPDGSRIAFVSQQRTSDDIWIIYPDGSDPRNLTPNDWEWDKHPSWSPDSTRIVFWSNRTGVKQIYIIDVNGQNLRRLSETTWDEYDPIWVK